MNSLFAAIRGAVGFETTIPIGSAKGDFISFRERPYLLVPIGALVGGIWGGLGFLYAFLPPSPAAALTLLSLYVITGINHPDGLMDFLDGLSATGSSKRKIEAMKDTKVGAAGILGMIVTGLLLYSGLGEILSTAEPLSVFKVLLGASITAKTSMVITMYLGTSSGPGMAEEFVANTTLSGSVVALAIACGLLVWTIGLYGLGLIVIGCFLAYIFQAISRNLFDGVSGDVLGAVHESVIVVSIFVLILITNLPRLTEVFPI